MNAPKVTPADIESEIVSEHYFTAEEGVLGAYKANGDVYVGTMPNDLNAKALPLLTFCVLILRNGTKVVGINHGPVDPANLDLDYSRKDARDQAVEQIWSLLGFRLRDKLALESAPFEIRLQREFAEARDRHAKLFAYIHDDPRFLTLSEQHQGLLQRQENAMGQYVDVLELRLKDLGLL